MKRKILLILFLSTILLFIIIATSNRADKLEGNIEKISNDSLQISTADGGEYIISISEETKIVIAGESKLDMDDLYVGQDIEVLYQGDIIEINPAVVNDVKKIVVKWLIFI